MKYSLAKLLEGAPLLLEQNTSKGISKTPVVRWDITRRSEARAVLAVSCTDDPLPHIFDPKTGDPIGASAGLDIGLSHPDPLTTLFVSLMEDGSAHWFYNEEFATCTKTQPFAVVQVLAHVPPTAKRG